MEKKLKFSVTLIILVGCILVLMGGKSQATLQSNPNTQYKQTNVLTYWVPEIRKMEDINGPMGLSEQRNEDLTSTVETNNNIDVHCMLATEYGAIAILSASGYGNPSNAQAITTTTGNNTGMILSTNYREWVSGVQSTEAFGQADARYYNLYTDAASAKIGDALGSRTTVNPGCIGWHSASDSTWVGGGSGKNSFMRGLGGIFSFNGHTEGGASTVGNIYRGWVYARGVAVCGAGL